MPVNLVALYEEEVFTFFNNSFFYYPLSLTLANELPVDVISFLI